MAGSRKLAGIGIHISFMPLVTAFLFTEVLGATYSVTSLNGGQPIITEEMFSDVGASDKEGRNINGPAVMRVPQWLHESGRVADPQARYYLYFAHHQGDYIRMAWAANIEGPYTLYRTGSDIPVGERGVLDLGERDSITMPTAEGGVFGVEGHIASPYPVVDTANSRIILYFHGGWSGQKTFVATSADGLNFNLPENGGQAGHGLRAVAVAHFYLTPFNYNGQGYGFTNYGMLWRAPVGALITDDEAIAPPYSYRLWSRTDGPIRLSHDGTDDGDGDTLETMDAPRHFGVRFSTYRPDELHVFFSRRYDAPERIVMQTVDLSQSTDWTQWEEASWPPEEILQPEETWEGADLPITVSENGSATGVHALRDPHVFVDGRIHLFYTGRGEEAIGVAEIVESDPTAVAATTMQPHRSSPPAVRFSKTLQGLTVTGLPAGSRLAVFDAEGRRIVMSTTDGVLQAAAIWHGVYVYSLTSSGVVHHGRLDIVR